MSEHDEEVARRALTIALRTASALMGSRAEAGDVAQDVAVDVLRSIDRLRDPQAFDAWVHRITVRHALRTLRQRRAARIEIPIALVEELDEPIAAQVDRDLVLAARDALSQALTTLPPRQRVALALRYVHDLTDREIAEALGCRRGTVNALLSRARATLREVPALQARGEVWLDFSLGRGAGIGDTLAGWRQRFAGSALVLLGPAPAAPGRLLDGRDRLPLLGVTARSVESLELRYAHGPPLVVDDVKGGFVLLAQARREPREIVAYDAAGNELGHVDVSHIHMPDP